MKRPARPRIIPKEGHNSKRWRITKIKDWREIRELSQQQVADAMAQLDPPIARNRNAVQRIENGNTKPPIDVVEAIAKVLSVDLHSMLNLSPSDAQPLVEFLAYSPAEQRQILKRADLALQIVRSTSPPIDRIDDHGEAELN